MKIREDTKIYFIQDKKYVVDYLKKRCVSSKSIREIYMNYDFGMLCDAEFEIDGCNYELSHFLSCSQIGGFDIKKANENLELDKTSKVALAAVLGDDVIYYDKATKRIYLWLIQTGDGEIIDLGYANDFIKKIN